MARTRPARARDGRAHRLLLQDDPTPLPADRRFLTDQGRRRPDRRYRRTRRGRVQGKGALDGPHQSEGSRGRRGVARPRSGQRRPVDTERADLPVRRRAPVERQFDEDPPDDRRVLEAVRGAQPDHDTRRVRQSIDHEVALRRERVEAGLRWISGPTAPGRCVDEGPDAGADGRVGLERPRAGSSAGRPRPGPPSGRPHRRPGSRRTTGRPSRSRPGSGPERRASGRVQRSTSPAPS